MTMIVFPEQHRQFHPSHDSKLTVKVNQPQPPPPETPTGWGCLLALSINETKKGMIDDVIYVHPLSKSMNMPWAHMTSKSLEMCTETLGSETGSDDGVLSFNGDDDDEVQPESPTARERRRLNLYKKSSPREFPPPLVTVSGSDGIRIRAKRDGGRLVMEAYSAPPLHCYVVADRSHGRLRLSLMRNDDIDDDRETKEIKQDSFNEIDDIDDDRETEEIKQESINEIDDIETNESVIEVDIDQLDEKRLVELQDDPMEEPEEESEEAEKEAVEQYESRLIRTERGLEEIKLRAGGRIGISDFQRPISRCNERREKIFMNWESFWVATS
ncbi:hypothetical protein Droror1_Dr00007790 [Drosera rotundifolia]